MKKLPTPVPPPARIADTVAAYATTPPCNDDAAFYDFFVAMRILLRVYDWPLAELRTFIEHLEAQPTPVDKITLGQLVNLVLAYSHSNLRATSLD